VKKTRAPYLVMMLVIAVACLLVIVIGIYIARPIVLYRICKAHYNRVHGILRPETPPLAAGRKAGFPHARTAVG